MPTSHQKESIKLRFTDTSGKGVYVLGDVFATQGGSDTVLNNGMKAVWVNGDKYQECDKTYLDAKSSEMRPAIEATRTALMEYKRSPNKRNLQILRAARSKVQQAARRCANEYYWTQLSQDIQKAAIKGTSGECTMALRRHWILPSARRPPSNPLVER